MIDLFKIGAALAIVELVVGILGIFFIGALVVLCEWIRNRKEK